MFFNYKNFVPSPAKKGTKSTYILNNMRKQIVFTLLSMGFSCISFAQEAINQDSISVQQTDSVITDAATEKPVEEISIVSFRRLENDITARVTAPKRDQNNDLCAIIKVVTKDKALFFEPDALGIVAREDQPGEIWLYVPHGSKRITIKHERFGIIRNYFYNESIDKATVYELRLFVPEIQSNGTQIIERIVEKKATEQALMMNYSPSKARIYIDDELQNTNDNGAFSKVLPLGQHNYRVVAPHHTEEKGTFDIVPERPSALNVALQPTYGFMTVNSNKDHTKIYINKEMIGNAPYQSDTINVGKYTVRAERSWYLPQEREIEIRPTETNNVQFALERQKANVFLTAQYGTAFKGGKQTSFGLMAGICRKAGGYISIRTNGSPAVDWNGPSNPYGIYSGKVEKHHLSTLGGFMTRLAKPVYLYFGGGYIFRTLDWQISPDAPSYDKGEYQTVQNHSGGMFEAGLIGRYKFISLSAGVTFGIPDDGFGKYMEATIGIGYVFGR